MISEKKTAENNEYVVDLSNVSVDLGGTRILHDINLKIKQGEYIGLIGKNGSGKTTLMKTILGLIKPAKGTVRLYGEKLSGAGYERVGYVPQMQSIKREFPATVKDVVLMGLYRKRLFSRIRKEDEERAKLALHKVKMENYIDRPIGHLSGGEQQKVLVAHALVQDPDILLLDEPTSALDFRMAKQFLELLKKINEEYNITLVVIQHNLELLRPSSSRIIMLRGVIMYDGPPTSEEADALIPQVFFY